MKIGMNLLVLGGLIGDEHGDHLLRLSQLGYDGVEIPIFNGDENHYVKLARRCADLGLRCTASTALGPENNPCDPDASIRARALNRLKWTIDNAHSLGAAVLCGPLYSPLGFFTGQCPAESELCHAADTLRVAAEHAAKAGVTLAIEPLNRFETYLINTAGQGREFVSRVGHPHVRLMYDTFHGHIEERDPVESFNSVAPDLGHIHIAENDRGIPGRGHADLAPIIRSARQSGYDGWIVIEAFGRTVPELAAATRVWRDLFPDVETLFSESVGFVKGHWRV